MDTASDDAQSVAPSEAASDRSGFSRILDQVSFAKSFKHVTILGHDTVMFGDVDETMLDDRLFKALLRPMCANLSRLDVSLTMNNEKSRYFQIMEILSWVLSMKKLTGFQPTNVMSMNDDSFNSSESINNEMFTDIVVDPHSIYVTHENTMKGTSGGTVSGPVEFILTRGNLLDLKSKQPAAKSIGTRLKSPVSALSPRSTPPPSVSATSVRLPDGIGSMDYAEHTGNKGKIAFIAEIKTFLTGEATLDLPTNNNMYQLYAQLAVAVNRNRADGVTDTVFGVMTDGFEFVFVAAIPEGVLPEGPIKMVRSGKLVFCTKSSPLDRRMKPTSDTRLIMQYLIYCIHGNIFKDKTDEAVQCLERFRSYTKHVSKEFVRREKDCLRSNADSLRRQLTQKEAEHQAKEAELTARIAELQQRLEEEKSNKRQRTDTKTED